MRQSGLIGLITAFMITATSLSEAIGKEWRAVQVGQLLIDQAWTRATPGGAKVGAGYMSIINSGETADRLVAGKSDIAERVEIHTMTMEGGVMRMRKLTAGLVLAPKSITELKPGGYHVMLIGLKRSIAEGEAIPLELTFEKAGTAEVVLEAAAIGAQSPPGKPAGAGDAAGSHSGVAGSRSGRNAAGSRSN